MSDLQFYTTDELVALKRGVFVGDVESFDNYFLAAFKNIDSGKYVYFESVADQPIQTDWLQWMLDNFCVVGFNWLNYDLPIISIAISGKATVANLKQATVEIIENRQRPYDVVKSFDTFMYKNNCIDLFDVAPLTGSLKTYAARLHCPHMQDLPFHPDKVLTPEEIAITRTYCFNDLDNTELLLRELSPHLELRAALSQEFGKDLRSRSDAQLAQEIICTEIARIKGKAPPRVDFTKHVGNVFSYTAPAYVKFQNPEYNAILKEIQDAEIEIGPSGHVICPKSIEGRCFEIGGKRYAIGMGGLHSQEKSQALVATNFFRIIDRDVTGYYPNLILKNGFSDIPGELEALQAIVDKRYKAKRSGDKVTADSLKIASNGTFGKKSDPFSPLYSPKNMVNTTLTGQLSLLMAIEALTLRKFIVASANTDGIVTLVVDKHYTAFVEVWKEWEQLTGLETEETEYRCLYARDVNNYIGFTVEGKKKVKGIYSEVGSALNSPLSKNPEALICADAVIAHIGKGVPIVDTITSCQDLRRFVTVRKVTGGGQKDGKYLGKTVRYYYAKNILGCIVACKSGNKVANTDGAKPCMTLPSKFPDDVDYSRYYDIAVGMLEDIGFQKRRNSQLTISFE
jgi:hypothetical protein